MRLAYPIEIRTMKIDEGGGYLVEFPDWDGAVTDGRDMAEALGNARDCLDELIADRIRRRAPIPPPSPVGNRRLVGPEAAIALKAALWIGLRENSMGTSELANMLGDVSNLDVRRLLNPRMKARTEPIHRALAVLGKRVVIDLEDAAGHQATSERP